ncbi:MAG: type II toxin-antitoxin system ParD family antitoxin [Gammaproteobacteria bacterium]|nr:type II toxin-antitoxin system ParD family antitoxin [Gammaproteobacteria bacterium]MDE0367337.1 type II toxin-antitoxin system ParD family antitoxin [Gammaproteobacteria bacterium]
MATVRKTITLTDQQDGWIKAQVANGDYTSDSEYFRDLVRQDQEKFRALKAAVEEGIASGPSTRTIDDIWAEAEVRSSGPDE